MGPKTASPLLQGHTLPVSRGCYFIHVIFLTVPKAHKIAGGVFPALPCFRNIKPKQAATFEALVLTANQNNP